MEGTEEHCGEEERRPARQPRAGVAKNPGPENQLLRQGCDERRKRDHGREQSGGLGFFEKRDGVLRLDGKTAQFQQASPQEPDDDDER